MRLSERLITGRKAFTQPPFWTQPSQSFFTGILPDREPIGVDFMALVQEAYKQSGVVFAASLARQMLFSQARFAFMERGNDGRPGRLFTTSALDVVHAPWPNGTTAELLGRVCQDADIAGNFFATHADDNGNVGRAAIGGPGHRYTRLRPDWVSIILGSKSGDLYAPDTRPIGYRYAPPGVAGRPASEPVFLLPSETWHYSPIPDPEARFRGMSWLTPVIREIQADKAATKHRLKFFDQGATLSTVVSLDKDVSPSAFEEFVEKFKAQHQGVDTAYKTLFLAGGADVTVNSANMQQMDFKATQGAGETRIAAASGIHPVIIGLSEGLAGSSLNAGNFDAAKRLTADKTLRFLWASAAASLTSLVQVPAGAELVADDRDIPFLRDNATDIAEIQSKQAVTARQFADAGWEPDSIVEFLDTGNIRSLVHSGRPSVQLQAPGQTVAPPVVDAPEGGTDD